MISNNLNNKQIAKNTMLLYIRMLLTMGVSLYTSRVVINALGIDDFGIYNVVCGVVVLFSFLNGALTQAVQRFLTYELGQQNLLRFNQIFSLSLFIYLGLAFIIIVLSETVGLWFLNTQLNIATERIEASNWIYQLSILTFFFSMMSTPYSAAIVAHEKMSFYAYISIFDVLLKLLIAYLLVIVYSDKLIFYAVLIAIVSLITLLLYILFATYKFKECRYSHFWDKALCLKLVSFSGWSMFGSLSVMTTNQGLNMLLNIFFGVTVNAAMGITNQISNAVNQLVTNFQMAFNPQITKSYATGDKVYYITLIFQSAKISYLLLLFVSLPVLINMKDILEIWLGEVPEYTVSFCRLSIISLLIDALSGPLWMVVQAKGVIKKYQLIISSIFFLNILFSFFLFLLGYGPVVALVIRCVISFMLLVTRLYLFVSMLDFPSLEFGKKVVWKVLFVSIVAFPIPFVMSKLIDDIIFRTFYSTIISFFTTLVFSYVIALNSNEKVFLKEYVINKIRK